MKLIRILILEDDLETLSILMKKLHVLEDKIAPNMLAVTVLSEYTQVEDYINKTDKISFDIILLDHDCKAGGSFHNIDIVKFGKEKVIGISSIPQYNEQLENIGITKILFKDYRNLEDFSEKVISQIESML